MSLLNWLLKEKGKHIKLNLLLLQFADRIGLTISRPCLIMIADHNKTLSDSLVKQILIFCLTPE